MKRKRWTATLVALAMLVSAPIAYGDEPETDDIAAADATLTKATEDEIRVILDGIALVFDTSPTILEGRTFVPLRSIADAFGAEIDWEPETQTVSLKRGDVRNILQIGSRIAVTAGADIAPKETELEAPPFLQDGRTMVPVRYLSETFERDVRWDGELRTVWITTRPETPPTVTADGKPILDFSNDADGLERSVHAEIRRLFEGELLPRYVFDNVASLRGAVSARADDSVRTLVDRVWNEAADRVAAGLPDLIQDLPAERLAELRELCKTDASDVYAVSVETTADGTPLVLLNLADVDAKLTSSYVGIAVPKEGVPRYFTLENSFNNVHMLCEYGSELQHTTYRVATENRKDAFLEATRAALAGEIPIQLPTVRN